MAHQIMQLAGRCPDAIRCQPAEPRGHGVHDAILPARYLPQGMTAVPPMAYVAETEPGTGSI